MAGVAASAGITLYTAVTLEELGEAYAVHKMDLGKGEQKEDWYLRICPNGRIPAIVDRHNGDLAVWESGAVLLYLAERDPERRLLPADPAKRSEVLSWLFWQVGGLGPMHGQADFFLLSAPQKDDFAIERYVTEVQRLFGVMERQLEGHEWLAADQYSIADIACFCWALMHDVCAIPFTSFYPNLRAWVDRIKARPAVQRGLNVPEPNMILHKPPKYHELLAKARARLEGLKPFVTEE